MITVSLINNQTEPKIRKDSAWLFQPELDEQLMAMLYRKQVEFAVGHGVAVDAEVARDAQDALIFDRATRVWTAVVPAYELPQTTPPQASDPGYAQLADLTVDMQALAEVPDGQFAAHLAPLAEASRRHWSPSIHPTTMRGARSSSASSCSIFLG